VLNGEDGEFGFFDSICGRQGVKVVPFYPSCVGSEISKALCMPGEYNLANAVCAFTVASVLGFSKSDILDGLSNVCVPGRCESVDNPAGIRIIIDYAHEGEGLARVLTALRKECHCRLICVFGAGGDRSPLRRHGMGKSAVKYADFSVVTNDNPRNEPPDEIIRDILEGIRGSEDKYTVIPDRKEAIKYALEIAREGDTVLLAGKGAQKFEEICGKRFPFDERKIVSEYYSTMNFPK
jgi:UDP-N-acetylmuramoyl-L-alanyl-D-glutamate--2,6-diaminopimelate ligase